MHQTMRRTTRCGLRLLDEARSSAPRFMLPTSFKQQCGAPPADEALRVSHFYASIFRRQRSGGINAHQRVAPSLTAANMLRLPAADRGGPARSTLEAQQPRKPGLWAENLRSFSPDKQAGSPECGSAAEACNGMAGAPPMHCAHALCVASPPHISDAHQSACRSPVSASVEEQLWPVTHSAPRPPRLGLIPKSRHQ